MAVGRSKAAVNLGDAGLPPVVGPPLAEVISNGPSMSALPLGEEGLELDEGFFVWSHPTKLGWALFMVDDVAEQAIGEAAS